MAVDPIPVLRRYDMNGLSKAMTAIATALNLGGAPVNHNMGSVPPNNIVYPFRSRATTLMNLPAAEAAGAGARALITDSQYTHATGLGEIAEPGGTYKVPVYSDGAHWLVG